MTLVEKEVHMYNGERANIYNYIEINEKFNIFSEFRDSQAHPHNMLLYITSNSSCCWVLDA